jgi:hypothetical protein
VRVSPHKPSSVFAPSRRHAHGRRPPLGAGEHASRTITDSATSILHQPIAQREIRNAQGLQEIISLLNKRTARRYGWVVHRPLNRWRSLRRFIRSAAIQSTEYVSS